MAAGAASGARDPQHDLRWKWLLLGLCVLSAAWVTAVAADSVGLGGRPWYGWWEAVTAPSGQPYRIRIDSVQPDGGAAKSGFHDGDWFDWREQSDDTRERLISGQPMATQATRVVVHRRSRSVAVPFVGSSLRESNVPTKLFDFIPAMVYAIWFLGCAFLISICRGSVPVARALSLILLTLSVPAWSFELPNAAASMVISIVAQNFFILTQVLLVRLSSAVGTRSPARRLVEIGAYAAIAANLLWLVLGIYGGLTLRLDPMVFGSGTIVVPFTFIALTFLSALGVIAAAIAATASVPSSERPRTAWLLLPIPLAQLIFTTAVGLSYSSWVSSWLALEIFQAFGEVSMLVGALLVTYALLKRRVLDFGFVLNRAVVVSIVGLIVVIAFVLLEWMLGSVLTGVSHATGLIANAALALVIGVSLNYVHKRVDHSVDLVLFRKRHEDERALLGFSKEAAYVTDWDALLDATLERLRRHTDSRSAALLIGASGFYTAVRSFGDDIATTVDENDGAILALKTWHKPIDPHHYDIAVHAALALPMLARGRLFGVLLLGERTGGEAYAPDEVEALSQLANGVGSALEALSLTPDSPAALLGERIESAIESMGEKLASEIRALKASSPA